MNGSLKHVFSVMSQDFCSLIFRKTSSLFLISSKDLTSMKIVPYKRELSVLEKLTGLDIIILRFVRNH